MGDELYIVAATAEKRDASGAMDRKVALAFVAAGSRNKAKVEGSLELLPAFPSDRGWRSLRIETGHIQEDRLRRYREEATAFRGPLGRITFLWGCALYCPDTDSLQCGTIIAQTREAATDGIRLRMKGWLFPDDGGYSLKQVPSKLIFPKIPVYEDPAEILRGRFPNITKP